MEESCGLEGKEQVNKSLNGQLYNADIDLQREAKRLITHLTDKVSKYTLLQTTATVNTMVHAECDCLFNMSNRLCVPSWNMLQLTRLYVDRQSPLALYSDLSDWPKILTVLL